MAAKPAAKPAAAAPSKKHIAAPDFLALNGRHIILDVDGKAEGAIRIDPKTHQITHKGGFASTWTVHGKSANVAQLQNFRYPELYLRVDSGKLVAGAAGDLTFTFKDGHGHIEGAPESFSVHDNTDAVDRVLSHEGPIVGLVIDWSLLDGAFITLDAPGAEGNLRVEGKPPAISCKGGKGEFATWEVDFIAPGQITLENQKYDNVYLRVVNGQFEASGTGKADATLNVTSNTDGTVTFAGVDKHFVVANNPKEKRAAKPHAKK